MIDAWHTGLDATLWALAAIVGAATALGPLAALTLLARQVARTRTGWHLRTLPTRRRTRAR